MKAAAEAEVAIRVEAVVASALEVEAVSSVPTAAVAGAGDSAPAVGVEENVPAAVADNVLATEETVLAAVENVRERDNVRVVGAAESVPVATGNVLAAAVEIVQEQDSVRVAETFRLLPVDQIRMDRLKWDNSQDAILAEVAGPAATSQRTTIGQRTMVLAITTGRTTTGSVAEMVTSISPVTRSTLEIEM